MRDKMKSETSPVSSRSLSRIFGKLKKPLAFARLRGGSFAGAVQLFYYAGLKSHLAYRGITAFGAGRIIRIPFNAPESKVWEVCLRDNGLDIVTLAEFFSPEAFIVNEFPDREPAVIYDIGANIGVASLFFGARYPQATIYGFEPLPSNYEICSMNYQNLNQARAFPWALGSSTGTATFEFEANDNRGGRLAASSAVHSESSSQSISVEVFSIADVIREKQLDPPELLKIDVEGAELEVLKGLGNHVTSVKAMHLETHGPGLRAQCLRWLRDNGFSVIGEREEQPGYGSVWCARR
jgi:FkbM family methyltransferase